MSNPPVTQIYVTVTITDGHFAFDPAPGNAGYQFTKGVALGTMVFKLASSKYTFSGCSFHPTTGGMPGVEARWSSATRKTDELVASFDSPQGALFGGNLHLFCIENQSGSTLVIDPQVGNDGETGDF